ncbi:ankyrin repeat domain-containing protein [Nocardiopsis valliformis]|uniref:ankyrin repeat domain-containing protein n=1 Tax=Nocardiopsis valliformis TaxID=239974 RepID=UPI000377B0A6|nr:ankyrin repeat domain-containing protein [Nocardiopsis valliformis]
MSAIPDTSARHARTAHHTSPLTRTRLPNVSQPEHDPEIIELATRLFGHARAGHALELAPYLQAGLPANLTNDHGDTLLMLASYHGHLPVVELLLEHGADPDQLNDRGQSPLAGAVFKGEDEIVRALVRAGANPDTGTPSARASARMFDQQGLLELFDNGVPAARARRDPEPGS